MRASRERLPDGAEIVRVHDDAGAGYVWWTVALVRGSRVTFLGCDKTPPRGIGRALRAAFPEARTFHMRRYRGSVFVDREVRLGQPWWARLFRKGKARRT